MSNWGGANRPITSNKLGEPNIRDGIDGDIQVRQSSLGAKLFAKIGGRWFDTPLSKEGIVKIGSNISNYLSIDNDSIDIFKNNIKVAEFGEDIKFQGKIIITSDATDNVCIGVNNSDAGTDNIALGVNAGKSLTSTNHSNILLGNRAGELMAAHADDNIAIGSNALRVLDSSADEDRGLTEHDNVAIGNSAMALIDQASS